MAQKLKKREIPEKADANRWINAARLALEMISPGYNPDDEDVVTEDLQDDENENQARQTVYRIGKMPSGEQRLSTTVRNRTIVISLSDYGKKLAKEMANADETTAT